MYAITDIDNFEKEIEKETGPVLLACIRRDYNYNEQEKVIRKISNKFSAVMKVCLLDDESGAIYKKLGIEGTPTFLLFYNGEEKDRILGKTNLEKLNTFVLQALLALQMATTEDNSGYQWLISME